VVVESLQHVQNVQCTAKKREFRHHFVPFKNNNFFQKNTLALMDFLICIPKNFTQMTPLVAGFKIHENQFSYIRKVKKRDMTVFYRISFKK
jgi:hypothetical protein